MRLIGRAVDDPDVRDPSVRDRLMELHDVLQDPTETLEAESKLAVVGERIKEHLGERPEASERPGHEIATDLRALLDEHRFEPMTLAEAGSILHASPGHLVRCFTTTFGIAPHRYVVARRIEAARRRLLDGEPVAQVASDVGFHDQAHFTRHFKRHVGTTPARYASSPNLSTR